MFVIASICDFKLHLLTFIVRVKISISLCCISVVQWMGSANGISGGVSQGAAHRATAGPGPVV